MSGPNRMHGERNGRARLTTETVIAIRRMRAEGHSVRTVAAAFGVSQSRPQHRHGAALAAPLLNLFS